ncbi:MAG: ABC transporter ATP-binding protein [Pseudomonadota bacterium]
MARIRAHGLVVEFPIYGASGRSLKNAVMRAATGGLLAKDASERIVVRALNGVSFELREGDRVGLVGHNGSGKTTLLRVLAGAYEPVAGTIEIEGRVASMLSISLGMDPEATGHENIFLRAAIMGMRPHEIAPLIEEIREFSELGDYIHMPLRTYSSGMAMRLAFAISTCVTADIILMDEWLSVGDAGFAKKAQERLARVLDRAKIMVLASHNEELIRDNCNRVIRLDHGEIIAVEDLGAQAAALRPMMPVPAAAT